MGFVPGFCPNEACDQHLQPEPDFFVRHGSFVAACHDEPVPRFRCRSCLRTFSTQTFRQDCWDRRPEVNDRVFELLVSGVGFRQSARMVKLGVAAIQQKARKLADHAGWLHENLSTRLPVGRSYVLDEEETYEQASIRTLTMPVLIEREHWFVVATDVGPTRRLAKAGSKRRAWQEHEERKHGRRPDRSRECVTTVLRALDRRLAGGKLVLISDEKASYAKIASEVFGDRVVHETTAGSLPRTTYNPLFPINTTLAMTRDNCGRLRRHSWLVSKKAECLRRQMHLFAVYRNYVRVRFNRDRAKESPATKLNLIPRNLTVPDAIRWRQDWGLRSIHPLCLDGSRSIGAPVAAPA